MHTIVLTPFVFSCKLPASGWINLAQIRQIQFDDLPNRVAQVTWHNGDKQTFFGEDAVALIKGFEKAITSINKRI